MDNRLKVQLLGGKNRKPIRQIKTHLIAKHRARASARPVAAINAIVEHMLQQREIGAHGKSLRFEALVIATNLKRKATKNLGHIKQPRFLSPKKLKVQPAFQYAWQQDNRT